MPGKPPVDETPPAISGSNPTASLPDLTGAARHGLDPSAPAPDEILSPAERLSAERTERRQQRAAPHKAPRTAEPRRARRRDRATDSSGARTAPRSMTFRDSTSISLIALLAAGAVLGAILGALGAPGWVVGLLVAGLTVVLSVAVRRYSPST